MHAVIYGKINKVAYKILGFETREGKLGLSIESGGCLPQKAWVQIVKGLRVMHDSHKDFDTDWLMPPEERKGGHVRKSRSARKPWAKDRISVCGMCGEYLVINDNGHVCGERSLLELTEGMVGSQLSRRRL